MPFDGAEPRRVLMLALLGIGLIFAIAWLLTEDARARWAGEATPETKAWYKAQRNQKDEWCCDDADGHPYYGFYEINPDGSVTVMREGKRHVLPAYMVLKGRNPTGHAVWWFTASRDYCFAPGTLS